MEMEGNINEFSVFSLRAIPGGPFSLGRTTSFLHLAVCFSSEPHRPVGRSILSKSRRQSTEATIRVLMRNLAVRMVLLSYHRHVSIDVVSNVFEGKNSMERQRMVFKAIWFELQDTVHAVDSMTTKTPAEASS